MQRIDSTLLSSPKWMIPPKDTLGGIYEIKNRTECFIERAPYPALPNRVRSNICLVIDEVPTKPGYVKIMGIEHQRRNNSEYVPILPTPSKSGPTETPIQLGCEPNLRLNDYTAFHDGYWWRVTSALRKYSFVKIDEYYEVPVHILREHKDDQGRHFKLWSGFLGGLGELQIHVRHRDLMREARNYWVSRSRVRDSERKVKVETRVEVDVNDKVAEESEEDWEMVSREE